MKKFLSLFIVSLSLILVTGCGEKSYTCTIEDEDDGTKETITFSGGIKMKQTKTYEFDSKEEAKEEYDDYNEECEEMKENGYKCTVKRSGKIVTVTTEIDQTPKKLMEQAEKEGYSCK